MADLETLQITGSPGEYDFQNILTDSGLKKLTEVIRPVPGSLYRRQKNASNVYPHNNFGFNEELLADPNGA